MLNSGNGGNVEAKSDGVLIHFPDESEYKTTNIDATSSKQVNKSIPFEFNLHVDEDKTEETENAEKSEENKPKRLWEINLPTGVQQKVLKQYLTAVGIAILTMWTCIYYNEPKYILGLLISGVLVYLGISTTLDYADGKIIELPVICSSVVSPVFQKTTNVVFRTNDDIPKYFEFVIPGKVKNGLYPNYAYVIYFKEDDPKSLIGYTQL